MLNQPVANRLKLFGGAVLATEEGPISGRAAQRHRIALLALLCTTRRLHRSRDQLVAFLWPEADADRGRKLLSDSIYRINQALGGDAIVASGEDLRLNRAQVGSDVADFEAAIDAGDWRRAVELHAGPILDGFFLPGAVEFDQWVDGERMHYTRSLAKALRALAADAHANGRHTEEVEWRQRLAALEPDDSGIAMELMRALEAAGNRAGAIRHARVHASVLRETLGVEPDPAVQALAAQIAARVDPVPMEPSASDRTTMARPTPARSTPVRATDLVLDRGPESPAQQPVFFELPKKSRRRGPSMARLKRPANLLVGVLGAGLLAAAVLAVANSGHRDGATPETSRPTAGSTLAVLPFHNLGESDSTAYVGDGMSEELTYLLSRNPGLRVASPTSVFAYRDLKLDVGEAARRLHVDWIVEGTVRRSGRTVRVMARLTDARSGYQIWSESFDGTSGDALKVQQEIANAIVNRLASIVGAPGSPSLVPDTHVALDSSTYDLYLQARYQWHRRTEESLKKSAALFEQVVRREPEYARAWTGLADAYAVLAFYDYMPPRVAYPRADSAAYRALQMDSTLAAPYATLGYVDTYYHRNWQSADERFRRAIALDPSYSVAHQWYSNLLTASGRFVEAEREMHRAAELDPLSMIAHSAIGWVLLMANQNDRAMQQLRSAIEVDSTFQLAHLWMGVALEQKGRSLDALPVLHHALNVSHGSAIVAAALAHAQASAGHTDSARAILAALLDRERAGGYIPSYEVAKVYEALGERLLALDRLERAQQEGAHSMAFLKVDPQLKSLAKDPRFQRLVSLLNQPAAQ